MTDTLEARLQALEAGAREQVKIFGLVEKIMANVSQLQRCLAAVEAKHWARALVIDQLFLAVARESPDRAAFLRKRFDGAAEPVDVMDDVPDAAAQTAAIHKELQRIFHVLDRKLKQQ